MSPPPSASFQISTQALSQLLICPQCDTVYQRPRLKRGEVLQCICCEAVLERHPFLSVPVMQALVVTALVIFVEANVWPLATLGFSEKKVDATLWELIVVMWRENAQLMAVLMAATLFFLPLAWLLGLGWLLLCVPHGHTPGCRPLLVGLHYLHPWIMNEVFVLAVLVAIVKAHLYFRVILNPGIFACLMLVILMTVLTGATLHQLWTMMPPRDCQRGI